MPRFLVVDNDAANALALDLILRADGNDVVRYTTGAEAVEALKSQPFDAVITDLQMPHPNGYAVVEAARSHSPDTCVVVTTAKALEKYDELAQSGACIISDKPVDVDAITLAVGACRKMGGPAPEGCPLRKDLERLQLRGRR
jgi:CheY-like chemotaxis protein